MKKVFLFLIPFCFAICFFEDCAAKAETIPKNSVNAENKSDDACQEWRQLYDDLSDRQKGDLPVEGITTANKRGYILSEQLVADCHLRLEIGDFIDKAIGGRLNESDNEFAAQNSIQIIRVLESTWNYYYDGAHDEKYLILNCKGLNDEDVAAFISDLFEREESFSPENGEPNLFYVLYDRPLLSLNQVISKELTKFEAERDVMNQFYALIILRKISFDSVYISKLKKLSLDKTVCIRAKNQLEKIIGEYKRNVEPKFDEIENFGMFYAKGLPTETIQTDK